MHAQPAALGSNPRPYRPSRWLAAFGMIVALFVGQPATAQTMVAVNAGTAASTLASMRAQSGLGPVQVSQTLMTMAAQLAADMAATNNLSHSVGGALQARFRGAGYSFRAAAENIGAGYANLSAAFSGWVASPAHYANILNRGVTEFGIAAARSSSGLLYWALILAAPR